MSLLPSQVRTTNTHVRLVQSIPLANSLPVLSSHLSLKIYIHTAPPVDNTTNVRAEFLQITLSLSQLGQSVP